jgi:nucleoside-diphosphate-sugar epimerase
MEPISFTSSIMAQQPGSASETNETKDYDVLVTGSSGHLGAALMLYLPTVGHRPLGIDILPSATTNLVGSISDRAFVASVFDAHPQLQHVVHAATLHKPHVESHQPQDFIDTNITGTQALLEAASAPRHRGSAAAAPLLSFVFISTTSTFGAALSPEPGSPAAWIDDSVRPLPKNIYGVTKCAAEDLCRLAHLRHGLPVVVLRTSRFFPEEDDDDDRRASLADDNLKVLELAYRRCDLADVAAACRAAMLRAAGPDIAGWARFVISAPPPFARDEATLRMLNRDPQAAFEAAVPGVSAVFARRGWRFLARLDRVYDSTAALHQLGWEPQYTFARTVERVAAGQEWRSDLALRVGKKGYHAVSTGVYTKR